jgi:hypothetical protein
MYERLSIADHQGTWGYWGPVCLVRKQDYVDLYMETTECYMPELLDTFVGHADVRLGGKQNLHITDAEIFNRRTACGNTIISVRGEVA